MVDAFDIAVGGILGPGATFNKPLKGRVKAGDVPSVLAQLIGYYKDDRQAGESFHQFVNRVGVPAFQEKLTGILTASAS